MSLPITPLLTPAQMYRAAMIGSGNAREFQPYTPAVREEKPCQFKQLLGCKTLQKVELDPSPEMLFHARSIGFFIAENGQTLIVRGYATTGTDVMWAAAHGRTLALKSKDIIPGVKKVCFIPHRYEEDRHYGSGPRVEWI